jgi:amidohydrolase
MSRPPSTGFEKKGRGDDSRCQRIRFTGASNRATIPSPEISFGTEEGRENMDDIKAMVKNHAERIIETRRELHRIPETAFTEEKTSAYVAERLRGLGLEVQTGIARYGVVGLMRGSAPGPTLMIRADMDALPITEETGLPFASTHPGAMHACGHDANMASALGAAAVLAGLTEKLRGNVKFVFQPAEEGAAGAKPMIEEGVLEDPKVDWALGCHLWPGIPLGTVGVKAGPVMAAMDRFDIRVIGAGCHGAMPHMGVDALEVGSQVVNALQRIVSRQMNPLQPSVVTVGSFHAGTAFNVIPEVAEMCGTTRTFDRTTWQSWPGILEKIVRGVCQSMGAQYEFRYTPGCPPTVNDPSVSELVRRCAAAVVGAECVLEPEPTMGGEDMSYYLERVKGCYFFAGVGREGGAPVHNPRFDFNEEVLLISVETFCRAAAEMLGM